MSKQKSAKVRKFKRAPFDTSRALNNDDEEVLLGKLIVNPRVQRELRETRVQELMEDFKPEYFGTPVINFRDGKYYIIDAQHRIEALRRLTAGDANADELRIKCRVYKNLTEQEEADMFDRLNDVLSVNAFDKWRTRITAKRETETLINHVLSELKLHASREKISGAVASVGTLVRVYEKFGQVTLQRALYIIRDAYGEPGLRSNVIHGIATLCDRYQDTLNVDLMINSLSSAHGQVQGLLGKAGQLRLQSGTAFFVCIAAAAVDIFNSTAKRGEKLTPWWREHRRKKLSGEEASAAL